MSMNSTTELPFYHYYICIILVDFAVFQCISEDMGHSEERVGVGFQALRPRGSSLPQLQVRYAMLC